MRIDRTNDGSSLPPRLRRDMNLGTMAMLPHGSSGWRATLAEQLALLKADGHVALQSWDQADAALASGFRVNGMGRVLRPEEFEPLVRAHKAAGFDASTLHVGNCFESDAEMDTLAGAMLEAAARHSHAVYIETHRAVQRRMGDTGHFHRLFMVPGMNHCATGAGPWQVDWLGVLEQWVEKGVAPQAITATHPQSKDTQTLLPHLAR